MSENTRPEIGDKPKFIEDKPKFIEDKLKHIAFIMDGNGRWAKKRGMPRQYGHKAGAETFRSVVDYCNKIGIKHVTVYAFSAENWSRPKREVNALMALLEKYLHEALADADKNRIRFAFIGDRAPLPASLCEMMTKVEAATLKYAELHTLNLAINYSGRGEIVNAVNKLIAEGKTAVTEDDISSALYTAHSPPPDLIVRTAGEMRLSNFLLWQASYSEFYATPTLWPDMTERDIDLAVEHFLGRTRKFGGLADSGSV